MNSPNPKLVNDLARLATKYSSRDWNTLLQWIDDSERREQLRALLVELAGASKTRRRTSKPKKRRPSRAAKVRETLAKIHTEDSERADLLEDIWLKLNQRELLPTIVAVRVFAEAMGFKGLDASRRDQAVTELMERLVELPGDALEQKMRKTAVEDRHLGDEYEGWVRLILNPPGDKHADESGSV